MAWVLPLITVAADLLGKKQKTDEFNATQQSAIEQQRQASLANIYSRGKTGGGNQFSMSLARQPESGDNGLGAALQLASAFGKSGSEQKQPSITDGMMKSIENLGGGVNGAYSMDRDGERPAMLEDWHPIGKDSSIGDQDKWKSGVSLLTDPASPDGTEDDHEDRLTNRLISRFSIR